LPVKHSSSGAAKEGGGEGGGGEAPTQQRTSRSLLSRLPSVGLGGSSKADGSGNSREGGGGSSSGSSSHRLSAPAQPKDPDAQLEGWIKKRGMRISSHWSDRYFVLKGDQLLYYLKPADQARK
jgi:hypothetical protein